MRFEKLVIAGVIFVSIFLAKFPTLYHALNTPKDSWFVKQASWFDAWDVNMVVSYLRYGERHGIMLQNTYTSISHPPVFIFQYYTFLGLLNRFLKAEPFLLFHIASVITAILLILTSYYIVSQFVKPLLYRLIMFLLIVLGGGFGWLPWFKNISAELTIPDFTFLKPLNVGHDGFSTLSLLLSLAVFYVFIKKEGKHIKTLIIALFFGIISIIFHPYTLLLFIGIGAVMCLLRWHLKWRIALYPLGLILFFILYYPLVSHALLTSSGWAGLVGQGLPSPNVLSLILGFGVLLPFIVWEIFFGDNERLEIVFSKVCFLIQILLIYLPLGFARQYIPGIYVWGAILAYYGMKELIKGEKIFLVSLVAVTVFSTLSTFYVFNSLLHIKPTNPYFFLTKNEGEALAFMSKLPADSGVLSLYRIGNFIPAFTDNKVYFGHFFQTPGGVETLKKAQIFYTAMKEEEQRKFISNNYIQYIYYGLEEANLRRQLNLSAENPFPYFPVLYRNNGIILYGISKTDTK